MKREKGKKYKKINIFISCLLMFDWTCDWETMWSIIFF